MKLYLDTEFNGFGGELISIGIVPADTNQPTFYRVVEWSEVPHPWVAENVVPKLDEDPQPRTQVARELAAYLRYFATVGTPTLVADWPEDFKHILDILLVAPGQMVNTVNFNMEFRRPLQPVASHNPHNALSDAFALRDHYAGLDKR